MAHPDAESPTQTIARRLREVRRRQDLSGQQLAERLQGLGLDWTRTTVAKVETGRRENITVTELLALALALDVSPIHLLVPLDDRSYLAAPNQAESANTVRAWVRGRKPLPGMDEQTFGAEVSIQDMADRVNRPRGYLLPDDEVRRQNQVLADQMEEMARRLRGEAL